METKMSSTISEYGNMSIKKHVKICRNLIKNIFACGLFLIYILKMEGPQVSQTDVNFIVNLKINVGFSKNFKSLPQKKVSKENV